MSLQAFNKDPDETLDYEIDWTNWLSGDTISSSSWSVPAGITDVTETHTYTLATVRLSGGTLGTTYNCVNTIVTTGGQTAQRSIDIIIVEK